MHRAIVSCYGNIRGKDFARKQNIRHGSSQTETTRTTLGTIDYLNKVKREARLNVKGEEGRGKDTGVLVNKEIDKMKCAELRAALKERGLRWTGVKADLVQRLKNPSSAAAPGRQLAIEDAEEPTVPNDVLWEDKLF